MHGTETLNEFPKLADGNENVHYTIDTAYLIGHYTNGRFESLLNVTSGKQEFLSALNKNYAQFMEGAIATYKPLVEKYPDRFLWGTDLWLEWQFDEDVYDAIVGFSRDFLGNLSPETAEKVAYSNAEKILKKDS